MIPLSARGKASGIVAEGIGRIARSPVEPPLRPNTVLVLPDTFTGPAPAGYLAVVSAGPLDGRRPHVSLCRTDHLDADDVVAISPEGHVRTLYRRHSRSNSLLATERCNSFCVMCSQPPRDADDSRRAAEMIRTVSLIHSNTRDLGITGGEPMLLGEGLLDVIRACRDGLPRTALHILSNGRLLNRSYSAALAAIGHPDLMIGIPLYSDFPDQHDYVVQATGAFDETMRGLHNLALERVPVEVRVVVHRATYARLPQLAGFIFRNLPFAAHVAFMGLEVIGFAKANIDSLWVDPLDYAAQLEEAVLTLACAGMSVSIYNHQLCTLPESVRPYARQSISDWKTDYAPECGQCRMKAECCGFFSWNIPNHRSRGVHPLLE